MFSSGLLRLQYQHYQHHNYSLEPNLGRQVDVMLGVRHVKQQMSLHTPELSTDDLQPYPQISPTDHDDAPQAQRPYTNNLHILFEVYFIRKLTYSREYISV